MNSIELTQNSNPLNTIIPPLPNVTTSLQRLHRQNSVHFNAVPIILNKSTQLTQGTNQSIQTTLQQLMNNVRQINSQNTQKSTNAPTPYYLRAASTQTPSPVIRRNSS